jgi:hypothetical protein
MGEGYHKTKHPCKSWGAQGEEFLGPTPTP